MSKYILEETFEKMKTALEICEMDGCTIGETIGSLHSIVGVSTSEGWEFLQKFSSFTKREILKCQWENSTDEQKQQAFNAVSRH